MVQIEHMSQKILVSTDNAATARVLKFFVKEPDDSLALAILLRAHKDKGVKIIGVTSSFGNTDGEVSYEITQKQVKLSGLNIPVVKGATHKGQKDSPAVEFIADKLKESKEKITLVALGPVTDFAAVFKKYPELKEKVEHFFLVRSGPYSIKKYWYLFSFNALADLEAAKFMYKFGGNQFSMGDGIFKIGLDTKFIKSLQQINHPMIKFISKDLLKWNLQNKFFPNKGYISRKGNMCPWDLVWSMYLVEPNLYDAVKENGHCQLRVKDRKVFLEKVMDLLQRWGKWRNDALACDRI